MTNEHDTVAQLSELKAEYAAIGDLLVSAPPTPQLLLGAKFRREQLLAQMDQLVDPERESRQEIHHDNRLYLGNGDASNERMMLELANDTQISWNVLERMDCQEFDRLVDVVAHKRQSGESVPTELWQIAKKLKGNRGNIVRFLAQFPDGVTLSEFTNYRVPGTGLQLIDSDDPDSISASLRRISRDLKPFGWRISARVKSNLIVLKKI